MRHPGEKVLRDLYQSGVGYRLSHSKAALASQRYHCLVRAEDIADEITKPKSLRLAMFFLSEGFTFRNFITDVFAVFMFVVWFWLLIISWLLSGWPGESLSGSTYPRTQRRNGSRSKLLLRRLQSAHGDEPARQGVRLFQDSCSAMRSAAVT